MRMLPLSFISSYFKKKAIALKCLKRAYTNFASRTSSASFLEAGAASYKEHLGSNASLDIRSVNKAP